MHMYSIHKWCMMCAHMASSQVPILAIPDIPKVLAVLAASRAGRPDKFLRARLRLRIRFDSASLRIRFRGGRSQDLHNNHSENASAG